MTPEQWALNYLATTPDPGLTPVQYAIGVLCMLPFIFAGLVMFGGFVRTVWPRLGRLIVALSLPVTPIIGVGIWLFIT